MKFPPFSNYKKLKDEGYGDDHRVCHPDDPRLEEIEYGQYEYELTLSELDAIKNGDILQLDIDHEYVVLVRLKIN